MRCALILGRHRLSILMALGMLWACTLSGSAEAQAGERQGYEDGYYIVLYYDSSGSVGEREDDPYGLYQLWSFYCEKDAMTDEIECFLLAKKKNNFTKGGAIIVLDENIQPKRVCVEGHDFPGMTAMIRIEKSKPVETDENGCLDAKPIWKQFSQATTVATQYYEWPYDSAKTQTFDMKGLGKSMAVLKDAVKLVD